MEKGNKMDFSVNGKENYTIVSIKGNLDAITSPEAEEKLKAEIQNSNKIILDLAGLEYISSAGLRVILNIAKILQLQGGYLALAGLGNQVQEVFEISGFTNIFDIYPDVKKAEEAANN